MSWTTLLDAQSTFVEALIQAATKRSGTGFQEYDPHTGKYAGHFPSLAEITGGGASAFHGTDVGDKVEYEGQMWTVAYANQHTGGPFEGETYFELKNASGHKYNVLASDTKPLPAKAGYTKVGGPLGSNGGQWYEDSKGQRFLVKPAQSPAHAYNEVMMGQVYREAGIDVPRTRFGVGPDGKYYVISEGVDFTPAQDLPGSMKPNMQVGARKGFGVDALTSNWDVYGLTGDNAGIDPGSGHVLRIDAGGAGLFRAQGGPKDSFAPGKPWVEHESMRTSAQGKAFYGDMSDAEAAASLEAAHKIDLNVLGQRFDALGIPHDEQTKVLSTLYDRQVQIPGIVSKLKGSDLPPPIPHDKVQDLAKATEAAKAVQVPKAVPVAPKAPAHVVTSSKHGDVLATGHGGAQIQVGGSVTMASGKTFTVVGPGTKPGYIHVKTASGHSLAIKQADVKSATPAGIKVGHGLEVHPGSKVITGKGKVFTVVGPGKSDEYLHVKTESGHSLAIKKNDVKPHGVQTPPGGFPSDKNVINSPSSKVTINKKTGEVKIKDEGAPSLDSKGNHLSVGDTVLVNDNGKVYAGEVLYHDGGSIQVHIPGQHPEGSGLYYDAPMLEKVPDKPGSGPQVAKVVEGVGILPGSGPGGGQHVVVGDKLIGPQGDEFTVTHVGSTGDIEVLTPTGKHVPLGPSHQLQLKSAGPTVQLGKAGETYAVGDQFKLKGYTHAYTITAVDPDKGTFSYTLKTSTGQPSKPVESKIGDVASSELIKVGGSPVKAPVAPSAQSAANYKTLADVKKGDVLDHKWGDQKYVVTSVSANGTINVKKQEHYGKSYGGVYKIKPTNTNYTPSGTPFQGTKPSPISHAEPALKSPALPTGGHKMLADVYTPVNPPKAPSTAKVEDKIEQVDLGTYGKVDVGGTYEIKGVNKKGQEFTETVEITGKGSTPGTFEAHPTTGYWANTPDKTFTYTPGQLTTGNKLSQKSPKEVSGSWAEKVKAGNAIDRRGGQGFVHLHPSTATAANAGQSDQVWKNISHATGVAGTSGTTRGKRLIGAMKQDDPEGYASIVKAKGSEAAAAQWAQSVASDWDGSSGSSESVALQYAISSRFNIPVGRSNADGQMRYAKNPEIYHALRDAMYADTQRHLAAQGVRSLTVYRGVSGLNLHDGKQQTVKLHAASSFTTKHSKAKSFGSGGHVLTANVEAERVFAVGGAGGWGWYSSGSEHEVVVLGSSTGLVVDISSGSSSYGSALDLPTAQPVLAAVA